MVDYPVFMLTFCTYAYAQGGMDWDSKCMLQLYNGKGIRLFLYGQILKQSEISLVFFETIEVTPSTY